MGISHLISSNIGESLSKAYEAEIVLKDETYNGNFTWRFSLDGEKRLALHRNVKFIRSSYEDIFRGIKPSEIESLKITEINIVRDAGSRFKI